MIKINLYDYRRVLLEVGVQKNLMTAMVVVMLGLIGTGAFWFMESSDVAAITEEAQAAEAKVKKLDGAFKEVNKLKKRKGRLTTVIKGLDGLRGSEVPVTQLMEDLSNNLPSGLWLKSLNKRTEKYLRDKKIPILFIDPLTEEQKKKLAKENKGKPPAPPHKFLEVEGSALSDRDISRFMERLEHVDYLDHVLLHKTKLTWVGAQQVRVFTLYAHMAYSGPKKTTS